MKKKLKVILPLITLLVLTFTLSGCTRHEIKLYDAMSKMQNVESMISETNIVFEFDPVGFSEEDQQELYQMKQILDGSKIHTVQKTIQNKDKTNIKAQMDMAFDVVGLSTNTQIWIESDTSDANNPKLREVIALPQIMKMSMPAEYQSKDYMVLDFDKILEADEIDSVDFQKAMQLSQDFQKKLTKFFKEYVKEFDPGFAIVESKGKETLNGESVTIYEMKLDNKDLKDLVRYAANDFLQNKETQKLIQDFVLSAADLAEPTNKEKDELQKEMEEAFKNLDKSLPEVLEKINTALDTFEDVKILGEDGIVIQYAVNDDNYIVNESGTIDLALNLQEIDKAMQKLDNIENPVPTAPAGTFNLGITFNTNIHEINGDVEVNIPTLNEQNSFDYFDMINNSLSSSSETVEVIETPSNISNN